MGLLPGFEPDATTWVMKDQDGVMRRVRVVDMTDQHLWRWIRYFRRKWRDTRSFAGSDAALDQLIQSEIITAPAIYAEANKRNVISGLAPVILSTQKPPSKPLGKMKHPKKSLVEAVPGARKITLDED